MIYFIELWNAKQVWLDLDQKERESYMNQVGGAIQNLLDQGVKLVTWSKNLEQTDSRASYDYFAIWGFPNQEIANNFQKIVEGAGWYNYFEQVNAMGKESTAEDVIGQLIQL